MSYKDWYKKENKTLIKMIEVDLDDADQLEVLVNNGWTLRGSAVMSPKSNCIVQMIVRDTEVTTDMTEEYYKDFNNKHWLGDIVRDLKKEGWKVRTKQRLS